MKTLSRFALFVAVVVALQIGAEWAVMHYKMDRFIRHAKADGTVQTDARTEPFLAADDDYLGAPGDIPLTFEAINRPVSILVGGHAGVVVDRERVVESSGLESFEKNITKYWRNNWRRRYDVVLLLRVHGSSEAQAAQAVREAERLLGRRYDYLFNRSENWIYCSEVPWIAWRKTGFNLNYDGFQTTPNDILVSPLTEIIYLRTTDSAGNQVEYWLREGGTSGAIQSSNEQSEPRRN